jgi:hypothetical protein
MAHLPGNELPSDAVRQTYESVNSVRLRIQYISGLTPGQPNNFIVKFGNDIRLQNVQQFQLLSSCITNSVPNISAALDNNVFTISTSNAIANPIQVVVPDNFYSNAQLQAYLSAAVSALMNPPFTFSITTNANGKNVMSVSAGSLNFVRSGLTDILGFLASPGFTGAPINAPLLPFLQGITYFHIASNKLAYNGCLTPTNGLNIGSKPCLFSIPNRVAYGFNNIYQGSVLDCCTFGARGVLANEFDIEVLDQDGNLVQLDGNSYVDIIVRAVFGR